MNNLSDQHETLTVILKYSGVLTQVRNQLRRRYDGGKQKSITFFTNNFNLFVLREKVELICPWVRGSNYELYYHLYKTSPKDYTLIHNENEVRNMIAQSTTSGRVEVVVAQEDNGEATASLQGGQVSSNVMPSDHINTSSNFVYNDHISQEDCLERNLATQRWEEAHLKIGARFSDAQSFRHAVRTSAISHNFGMRFIANNKSRVIAICSHRGCPWRVYGALCRDGSYFEIRKLEAGHSCPGINRAGNKQATTAWIAQEIGESIERNPDLTPKLINNNLESTYGLSLPYMKLWRAREAAREQIFGSVDDSYRWVPALHAELITRNPGSHIVYACSEEDNSFKRFFTSFKVSIEGFFAGCRLLIGLDACHLKSKYLGVLLSANSLDGNNGLFTLAFAVAETESKGTWQWFLENLAEAFGNNTHHLAFISDMEKGLAEAMKTVFPDSEHRVCIRHLWKNLKKFFHYDDTHKIKTLIWSAANAYITSEFDGLMTELQNICPQVHSYLISLPYKWSRSHFWVEIKNHYNTNNMSESFNSWIAEARDKPAVELVDMIRAMLMEQRYERKQNSYALKGELVPYAEEYLRSITTRKEQFIVRQMMPNRAEVVGNLRRHVVDTTIRDCSCGVWQATGLPCIHAAVFIGNKEHPVWHTFVHDSYHVTRYRMAYDGPISTMLGKEQWVALNNGIVVGVPNSLRPRGRPKKRRFQNFLENTGKTTKSVHKCGRCGIWGHHRNTCKNPLSKTNSSQCEVDEPTIEHAVREKLPFRRESIDINPENLMTFWDDDPLLRI